MILNIFFPSNYFSPSSIYILDPRSSGGYYYYINLINNQTGISSSFNVFQSSLKHGSTSQACKAHTACVYGYNCVVVSAQQAGTAGHCMATVVCSRYPAFNNFLEKNMFLH